MKYDNPHMSEHSPRMGNAFTRALGSFGLKLTGWELVGQMPDVPKFVIIGVPHTSNWDAISASLAMLASGMVLLANGTALSGFGGLPCRSQ